MTYDTPDDGTESARESGRESTLESTRESSDLERRRDLGADLRPSDVRWGSLDRRDYLRALGAVGGAGVLGSTAATSASAQSSLDEAAADQRIQENQTGPLTVEVVDEDGDPVPGATVDVEMQEHDFAFGSACGADPLINQFDEGDPYREHLRDLFNTAVLGNDHKWAFFEDNPDLADAAVDWLEANGFRIRGHTCVYPVDYAVPGDVMTAVDNGNGQLIRDRTMQHIEDIITHYGDRIVEWDVVNEVLHRGLLHSGVYPGQIDLENLEDGEIQPWTSPLLADWYSQAESVIDANGLDVDIVTNDYNTMTWSYARSRYAEQIEHLQSQGVGVDAIGLQSHIGPSMGSGESWTYANVDGVFEHYAQFDTNVRITEYDMSGDEWTTQQRSDVLERFLKTSYGHPNVDEFVIWGMWDETHWLAEAPFFEEDWTEKPALDVWRNLVFDEWWTSATGTTGSDGTYVVDAFLGEHEVTVSTGEGPTTETVEVTNADGGQRLVVAVEGDGEPRRLDAPAVNAGGEQVATGDETYVADDGFTGGQTYASEDSIAGTDDDALYQPERFGESFSYQFALENGTYDVELHFAETYHEADGERVFDVLVNDSTEISDLDVHAEAGFASALTRTVQDVTVTDGTLTVAFEASVENAKVNAIRVADDVEDGESCGGAEAAGTAEVEGQTVCDLNDDGLYRDVTGDGEAGQDDVVHFFENQHRDAWKRPGLFDFSESGDVGHGDVVALFEHVATGA